MLSRYETDLIKSFWDKVKTKADKDKIITIDGRWAVCQQCGDEILKEMVGEDL